LFDEMASMAKENNEIMAISIIISGSNMAAAK
jgi:hypothetical protein